MSNVDCACEGVQPVIRAMSMPTNTMPRDLFKLFALFTILILVTLSSVGLSASAFNPRAPNSTCAP